jgi:hypothetical protein
MKQTTHTQQNARLTAYLHLPFKQIAPFTQDTEVQAKQNKKSNMRVQSSL